MAEIINLNRERKARGKIASQKKATENRITFGRSRSEKTVAKLRLEQLARNLDGSKRTED